MHRIQLIAIAVIAAGCATCAWAQPAPVPAPEAVVRAYADAANRHDLDDFLTHYSPEIRKFTYPAEFRGEGLSHYRQVYERSFAANPDIKVEIVDLIVVGDKVVSHDRVTGLPGGRSAEEITVYQVRDGKIVNMVLVEKVLR